LLSGANGPLTCAKAIKSLFLLPMSKFRVGSSLKQKQ
jgi:hypothetical protein